MKKYSRKITNQIRPGVQPPLVKKDDRVVITFINKTSMSRPMQLHGHTFRVTAINEFVCHYSRYNFGFATCNGYSAI